MDKRHTERELTADQQSALLALDQLLGKAKSFENPKLKVKTQARIADILWAYDELRARRLFEEAFSDADSLDMAKSASGITAVASPPRPPLSNDELRWEVLALVSRHDTDLAEKLALSASRASSDENTSSKEQTNYQEMLSEPYLQAALSIVESDPERAAQLIKLSLNGGIGRMFPKALGALRGKRSAAADEIYRLALAVAGSDTAHIDEKTRLLALYVFPAFGMPPSAPGQSTPAADPVDGTLIRSFLSFTFDAAMRWHSKVINTGNQAAAVRDVYDYDTAQALQPYLIRYMPDKADQFRLIVSVMSQTVPRWQINDLAAKIAQPAGFDETVKEAEAVQDSLQKDLLYFRAAMTAAGGGEFERALSLVEKVSSEDFRVGFDAILRLGAVNASIKNGEIDLAYRYAKDALDVQQRAALLGRIANALIDKKDISQALKVLDDAEQLIGKTAESNAQGMLILADAKIRLDTARGFEYMEATIKAFNRADANANERDPKPANISNGIFSAMINKMLGASGPDFERGFLILARSDFNRALELAQSLEDNNKAVPAGLAVCQSVLLKARTGEK